jgi:predicted DNA binding protein
VAHEIGYYDTHHEVSLSEVADELGIAKSTRGETLPRVEGDIMDRFLG